MTLINCRGKKLDLSCPQVMGILNITPNSFSTVGRFLSRDDALKHADNMVQFGAAIIDIGGEPTNPGVHPVVSLQEELDRVLPIVEALAHNIPVPISIDTSKPEVMREAMALGAGFINDVRALQDPDTLKIIAETGTPVCLMHMAFPAGKSSAQANWLSTDEDVVQHIKHYLSSRVDACMAAGIFRDKIVIDPGIGGGNFGKNLEQNLQILARLDEFKTLELPILVGVSRKLFIGELLNIPVEERLSGSLAAAVMSVVNGASIIRAHDVKETVQAVKMAVAIQNGMPFFSSPFFGRG
jgi:dihydropteroate synthase